MGLTRCYKTEVFLHLLYCMVTVVYIGLIAAETWSAVKMWS